MSSHREASEEQPCLVEGTGDVGIHGAKMASVIDSKIPPPMQTVAKDPAKLDDLTPNP